MVPWRHTLRVRGVWMSEADRKHATDQMVTRRLRIDYVGFF